MLKKLRKSSQVTLVLMGVATLTGCDDPRRDVYASREQCLADWGNKPEDCKPSTDPTQVSRGYWMGPYYTPHWYSGMSSWSGSSHSSTHSIGHTGSSGSSVSRGGFGSSSSSHSSGS